MPGRNADPRPLPPGWTAHFDHQRNMWYYVNLNTMPPQLYLSHPDDQASNFLPIRQRRGTVPSGPIAYPHHDSRSIPNSHSTPFAAAIEAQNAKEPTFAQKLYASSLPPTLPPPNESSDIEEGMQRLYGFSNSDVPWRTPSPQEVLETIPTQPVRSSSPLSPMSITSTSFASSSIAASPTSSPPPFSSPLPEWNPPTVTPAPSRRPRGARTPSFPRRSFPAYSLPIEEVDPRNDDSVVLPQRSSQIYEHQAVSRRGTTSEISSILLPSLQPPLPVLSPPPLVQPPASIFPDTRPYLPPMPQKRTRHNRSATFPNITQMNTMVGFSQTSSQISKPKETPMYTLVARPPEDLEASVRTSTSTSPPTLYSNLLPLSPIPLKASQTKPILPPLVIPKSSGTGLPVDTAITVPNMNLPPTQPLVNNDQRQKLPRGAVANLRQEKISNPPHATHGNHEVLKQVGIAVGKSVGKSALRLGTKALLGSIGIPTNPFSNNSNDTGDAISSGLANLVVSAASAATAAAMKSPTIVPSSTIPAPDYAAMLARMQEMQIQQPTQQIMPQQSGFNPSNAQMAALMAQMQMLQLQQAQLLQPSVQIPLGNNSMTAQNMQNVPQQVPQWQQSLVSNAIGEPTQALVAGAISNFNVPGTMDSDNGASSFTDSSFDANA